MEENWVLEFSKLWILCSLLLSKYSTLTVVIFTEMENLIAIRPIRQISNVSEIVRTHYILHFWFLEIKYNIFCLQKCRDPGSNRGPLDLQSNALPTELSRQDKKQFNIYVNCELSDAFNNEYMLTMNMFILKLYIII